MKQLIHFLIYFCLLSTVLPTHAETSKANYPGSTAEIYKHASGDDLYLYIFNPKDHDPAKDQRAAIVFFFGGGWNGGSTSQFQQHTAYLASRGMIAVLADYRVASRQKTTPMECVADGKSAVRWLRKNASRLGIDPNRIAAGGGSAGGHVAATTGIISGLDDPADDKNISSKANALVLYNPVYDNSSEGYGYSRVKDYWKEISPLQNIDQHSPPTIVFLGTKDKLIPVATAKKFDAKLKAAGIQSELHLYQDQPHGFFNEGKGGTKIFLDTLRKTDAFLTALGYLEGKPTEQQLAAASTRKKNKRD
ncbi:MAG: alpha/beta hydrolase [Verrucomicrobiales bacterium]|nr:alpha/beta hydrolase [Verrucomicrobiales bacterium]